MARRHGEVNAKQIEADQLESKSALTPTPRSEEERQIQCFHIWDKCDQIYRS